MSLQHKDLWVNRKFASSVLSMGVQNFDERIRPRLEPKDIQGEGTKSLKFYLPAVVEAFAAHRLELAGGGDPLLTGGDSPALERYRKARAETVEIELARIKGELIPYDEVVRMGIQTMTAAKNAFLAIPARLSIECGNQDPPVIEKLATEIVHNVLTELSQRFETLADDVVELDKKKRESK